MLKKDRPVLNDELIESKRSVSIFLKNLEKDLANNWTVNNMAEHCVMIADFRRTNISPKFSRLILKILLSSFGRLLKIYTPATANPDFLVIAFLF